MNRAKLLIFCRNGFLATTGIAVTAITGKLMASSGVSSAPDNFAREFWQGIEWKFDVARKVSAGLWVFVIVVWIILGFKKDTKNRDVAVD